jgi:hypothetical protein
MSVSRMTYAPDLTHITRGGHPIGQVQNMARLVTYIAFSDGQKAIEFEHYLESSSGKAFANKRLR